MNQDFQVVAELYQFLAKFDTEAISAASKLPSISKNLRTALIALRQESRNQNLPSKSTNSSQKSANKNKKNGGSIDPLGLLSDSQRFPSKHELYELAEVLGIEVEVNAKDSRERVARRIANIVVEDASAREKLYNLVSGARDSQTSGWFELIRRGD